MLIDKEKCSGCGRCLPYCPYYAISMVDEVAVIDQVLCVECGNCIRQRFAKNGEKAIYDASSDSIILKKHYKKIHRCPSNAIYEPLEEITGTPREIRRFFSNPATSHKLTGVPGRGTEEVKTNDVTARISRGEIGIAIEMGRPCLGTNFVEVEKVTIALAKLGVEYEHDNPLTHLMEDPIKGTFKEEYKQERVISAIVECRTKIENMEIILKTIKEVASDLDTVFSLDLICCFDEDGTIPVLSNLEKIGMTPRANAKVNLGMGRPLVITRESLGGD